MLVVHLALSLLLLAVLVVAGVLALVFRGQVDTSLKAQMVRQIQR